MQKKEFVNFTDNQFLDLSVQEQSPGDYLWVINNPSETVGVWKNDSSNNSSTAYLNGSIVSGDYVSKISYKAEDYYYIRNAQGDVIGLIDKNGSQVVSYNYDTWGKLILATGTLAATVGVKNPYRYRGYRYDTETGIYNLQSRYYNADWGRFINADGVIGQTGELLAHNLFSYCKNNPVNMHDNSGFRPAFDSVEDQTDYYDWLHSRKAGVAAQLTNADMKPVGYKKRTYRKEPANDATRENEHIHLKGDGEKYQQDIYGNRRTKENSPGDPPRKAKEALKEREGWDWDLNATRPSIAKGVVVTGGAYVLYRGARMIPSLFPPFWWTIVPNAIAP